MTNDSPPDPSAPPQSPQTPPQPHPTPPPARKRGRPPGSRNNRDRRDRRAKCMAMNGRVRCSHFARQGSRYCYVHAKQEAKNPGRVRDFADAIPAELRPRFKQVLDDPELLSVRPDVALFRLRQEELLKRLETRESSETWDSLREAWSQFAAASRAAREAKESGDAEGQARQQEKSASALQVVGRLITEGAATETIWDEATNLTERVVQVKRAEHSRIRDQQAAIAYADVMLLAGMLLDAVIRHTPDQRRLNAIAAEFEESMRMQGVSSMAALSAVASHFHPGEYFSGEGAGAIAGDGAGDSAGAGDPGVIDEAPAAVDDAEGPSFASEKS